MTDPRITLPRLAALAAALALPASALAQETDTSTRPASRPDEQEGGALGASTERFLVEDGAEIYRIVCSGCHQPNGSGAIGAGVYPPLSANPVLEGSRYPAWIVVHGMGAMPAFGDWLTNEQIVDVVGYIQSSFGNDWETDLTAQAVEDLRPAQSAPDG
jgi:mono/diheme cytochrome c family protein